MPGAEEERLASCTRQLFSVGIQSTPRAEAAICVGLSPEHCPCRWSGRCSLRCRSVNVSGLHFSLGAIGQRNPLCQFDSGPRVIEQRKTRAASPLPGAVLS
jgi:hypothetical protein